MLILYNKAARKNRHNKHYEINRRAFNEPFNLRP